MTRPFPGKTMHPYATRVVMGTALAMASLTLNRQASATDFHVGPRQALQSIGEVPWARLSAGDHVYIHWRRQPYAEKWVINRQGTTQDPIVISGVPGPQGERPVVDGRNAVTAPDLDYSGEERGVIKVGGSSLPADDLARHLIIEGLEVRSANPDCRFTDDRGETRDYKNNAASIYVQKATDLVLRDCVLHDSGNGLFIGASDGQTRNILVEKNYIHGNGNIGSVYEHNIYGAAIGITYQYNRLGPLREGAGGNNLKDRSAGLTVRYNWIEGGNRLLDLVDAEDSQVIVHHPSYHTTFVYGNLLIERDGGNRQVMHYGGDSGTIQDYRKGTLYFYHNTLYSTRAGNTTLVSLSTDDESIDVRNNILFVTARGNMLALLNEHGKLTLSHNWIKPSWVKSHGRGSLTIDIRDDGSSIEGTDPGFVNGPAFDFRLTDNSEAAHHATRLPPQAMPDHGVKMEYGRHQRSRQRPTVGALDLGAYERSTASNVAPSIRDARTGSSR